MHCPRCESEMFTERFPLGMDEEAYLECPEDFVRVVAIYVCSSDIETDHWPRTVLRDLTCENGHKFFIEDEEIT